jgi:iron-sulfur cluster assembly protein
MEVLENVDTAPLKFTETALEELQRLRTGLGEEAGKYLRIGVKGGGCSGLSYLLAFDDKEEQDNEYHFQGLNVIMNKAHLMYVFGMQVDWVNGLNNRGFVFENPNAQSTCGCGESFSV